MIILQVLIHQIQRRSTDNPLACDGRLALHRYGTTGTEGNRRSCIIVDLFYSLTRGFQVTCSAFSYIDLRRRAALMDLRV